jgi:hypothetical protein
MRFTTNAMLLLACALSVFMGNTATCQTRTAGARLEIGTRIRVSSSVPGFLGSPRVANVLSQRGDTLSLRPEGTQDSIPLPLGSITRLEVSAGRSSHRRQGMGLGLLGGALIGAVVGAATYTPCSTTQFLGCLGAPTSRGGQAEEVGLVGALIGTFVGGFIGARRQTENWERVAVTARNVSVRIAPSGKAGLVVSAAF